MNSKPGTKLQQGLNQYSFGDPLQIKTSTGLIIFIITIIILYQGCYPWYSIIPGISKK
jgi:hypothetical protein